MSVGSSVELGTIAEFRNGLNFTKDDRGVGVPIVGVSDFSSPFVLDYSMLPQVNADGIASDDDYLRAGDVVFVRSNGNKDLVGRSIFIRSNEPALFSGFCIRARIDSSKIEPLFGYYYSKTGTFKKQLAGTSGSNIQNLNQTVLGQVRLPNFALSEQQKIATVLSALDAKIVLNNRINAELEALAKTIYDYWFVQFDFPDAKGRPYKTSGGAMVWNEALKREIPAGWGARTLGDVISRCGTGLNPRDNFELGSGENYYVTIKNITNGRIVLDEKCDKIDDGAMAIIDRRSQLHPGDVLFTSIDPVGVTYLIHEKPTNWNINESVFSIRPDERVISPEYLLMLLSSTEMKAFTKNSSAGSIHKGIRHAVLKSFKLPNASKNLVDAFSSLIRPMLQRMSDLEKENRELTRLRDWLLPLLMNGQVCVG